MKRAHPALDEAKNLVQEARSESGATYQQIADGIGIARQHVYNICNRGDERYHLRMGDLVALSRDPVTAVRLFVHALLLPIIERVKPSNKKAKL